MLIETPTSAPSTDTPNVIGVIASINNSCFMCTYSRADTHGECR
jgi:hypothetical protein